MKNLSYLLTIVIMTLLSLFSFIAKAATQPASDDQEILLCIKYQPDEPILSPRLVVLKPQSDLLKSTHELTPGKTSANHEEEEKDDTLF